MPTQKTTILKEIIKSITHFIYLAGAELAAAGISIYYLLPIILPKIATVLGIGSAIGLNIGFAISSGGLSAATFYGLALIFYLAADRDRLDKAKNAFMYDTKNEKYSLSWLLKTAINYLILLPFAVTLAGSDSILNENININNLKKNPFRVFLQIVTVLPAIASITRTIILPAFSAVIKTPINASEDQTIHKYEDFLGNIIGIPVLFAPDENGSTSAGLFTQSTGAQPENTNGGSGEDFFTKVASLNSETTANAESLKSDQEEDLDGTNESVFGKK